MSQNLRLVEYFSSEFYRSHTLDLAHIASTTFEFSVNSGPTKNFEEYAKRTAKLNKKANLIIGEFTSEDDIHFHASFETKLDCKVSASGKCMFKVSRGLLERVNIDYDMTKEEFEIFNQLLFK